MFSLFLNCSALHAVVVGRLILVESIVRGLMFLAGVLGNNWLAVRSFPTQRSSVRTNEVLFLNLALSNLITNYLVDLPDTVADFAGRWFLGETYCGIFRFCADLSETSSIFTTLFISVFWHQKLVGSLKRGGSPVQMDSLCLVACLLAGSWTVAVVFSIPHFFFVKVEGGNESSEDCIDVFPNKVAKQTYEIIYLTLANAVPVAGIVFCPIGVREAPSVIIRDNYRSTMTQSPVIKAAVCAAQCSCRRNRRILSQRCDPSFIRL
uniref:Olfactory receptor class A related 5 n=1 Tax=Takifugu rubripes TaxID=31033 RepID=A0A3B5KE01_TAKRU